MSERALFDLCEAKPQSHILKMRTPEATMFLITRERTLLLERKISERKKLTFTMDEYKKILPTTRSSPTKACDKP